MVFGFECFYCINKRATRSEQDMPKKHRIGPVSLEDAGMTTPRMTLSISEDDEDVAYLTLPDHPGRGTPGVTAKQTRLRDLMAYSGPDLYLDFDRDGKLIGVEILV
jgi:uncharacterized protein YuzE